MFSTFPDTNLHVFATDAIHILHALSVAGPTTENHLAQLTSPEIVEVTLPALLADQTVSRDNEGLLSLSRAAVNTSAAALRDYLLV